MQWTDVIGLAGLSMLGTLFLFPSSADLMNWKYLLGGFVLWLVGFVSLAGWLLWHWFGRRVARGRQFRNKEPAATSDEEQLMEKKDRTLIICPNPKCRAPLIYSRRELRKTRALVINCPKCHHKETLSVKALSDLPSGLMTVTSQDGRVIDSRNIATAKRRA